MSEKDGMTELAMMFKERSNTTPPSITTGFVLSSTPNPEIRLNDTVILYKENLIFSSHLLEGYGRGIKFTDSNCGTTTTENDGGMNASSHKHGIETLNVDTAMEWTDTLLPGDEVILMPTIDKQLYYVIDRAVRFE